MLASSDTRIFFLVFSPFFISCFLLFPFLSLPSPTFVHFGNFLRICELKNENIK